MSPREQLVVGITVLVAGGLLLAVLRWSFARIIAAVGDALITHINGSLGLDGIREDVSILKHQVKNLESQLEVILTDL